MRVISPVLHGFKTENRTDDLQLTDVLEELLSRNGGQIWVTRTFGGLHIISFIDILKTAFCPPLTKQY